MTRHSDRDRHGQRDDVTRAVADLVARFGLASEDSWRLAALVRLLTEDPHAPTTLRDPLTAVRDHLADSLVALELEEILTATRIADLGAGAGLPGLPLAIALSCARMELVESNGRKCAFLRRASEACGLSNVEVVHARAEEWSAGMGQCDLVTARALAPLAVVAEYAAPLLAQGGMLVAWRGRRDAADEAAAARAAPELGLEVRDPIPVTPYAGALHRHLHVLVKVAPTPDRFPRRPGVARKRPLGSAPPPLTGAGAPHLTARGASFKPSMGTVYAIANQKGGVGKTTTAVNLAACVAEAGYESLLIDIDPQSNATLGLGIDKHRTPTVYEALVGDLPLAEAVIPSSIPHLSVVSAGPDLAGANVELPRMAGSENRLRDALAPVRERFAFVLLDCPPSLGPLTVNALVAADRVIVPVQAEYFALEGLAGLLDTLSLVQRELNPRLTVAGMLLTMHDGRTRLAQDVEAEVRRHFPKLVFNTVIPRNVRVGEAPSFGKPVIHYDPHCAGSDAYFELAKEVAARG
jgi:chromosome partitioning protein